MMHYNNIIEDYIMVKLITSLLVNDAVNTPYAIITQKYFD